MKATPAELNAAVMHLQSMGVSPMVKRVLSTRATKRRAARLAKRKGAK